MNWKRGEREEMENDTEGKEEKERTQRRSDREKHGYRAKRKR